MQLGQLVRAYAWEVSPQQQTALTGGAVAQPMALAGGLEQAATKSKLTEGMPVGFVKARNNLMCKHLRDVAFGTADQALAASQQVAAQLRSATDQRSKPCLLVVSCHGGGRPKDRQVLICTFPKDQVLQRSGQGVHLLDDVFSLTSRLRKAALTEGPNSPTGFLKARVVDFETTSSDRSVADFWVTRFLTAAPEIGAQEGTARLARVLKGTNAKLQGDPAALAQLHAAIASVRTGPQRKQSLTSIAANLLSGAAQQAFKEEAGTGAAVTAVFDVNIARLDELIQYRVFRLDNAVTVSAPFFSVGSDENSPVRVIETHGTRRVTASGIVESEKIGRTRA